MPKRGESPDQVDDAISEFGWRAVQAGDHRKGEAPEPHVCTNWIEDETGAEPPFDTCFDCGKRRY